MDISSKNAVVTGASRGTGRAITLALLEKGAKVYGIARNASAMTDIKDQWGKQFVAVELDISDETAVKKWAAESFSEENLPSILVNNAGFGTFGSIEDLPSQQWHQMINTNLNGVMYLTSAMVPWMKKSQGHSHIINMGSILGKVSGAGKSAYSASKFAIQGFSEALFKELRKDRIKVSCVNPGSIETSFFEGSGVQPNDRMLQPREIADVIVFLLQTPDNVLIDELTVRPLNP